jgi:hypothetical protein
VSAHAGERPAGHGPAARPSCRQRRPDADARAAGREPGAGERRLHGARPMPVRRPAGRRATAVRGRRRRCLRVRADARRRPHSALRRADRAAGAG